MRRRWVAALAVLVCALMHVDVAGAASPSVTWRHYVVRSAASGKIERFWVGHRADLDAGGEYPAIYFLDGLLGHEDEWKQGLDPHLGRHEIVAVCPSVGGATWYMNSPARPWMRWGDFLTLELRSFVEANYPASRKKGQRGIVGISAGAHGALYQALARDLYGSVGLLSPAIDLRGYIGGFGLGYWVGPRSAGTGPLYAARSTPLLVAQREDPLPFELYVDAGKSDPARTQMMGLAAALARTGTTFKQHVGTGGHNWTYWRSRIADHLAWHAEQFARHAREGVYATEAPPAEDGLKPATVPDVTLSDAAKARLTAAWDTGPGGRFVAVTGLPEGGAPLAKTDANGQDVALQAGIGLQGHEPQVRSCRLELDASTPIRSAGSVTLVVHLRNGRRQRLASAKVSLPVPAGEPKRRVPARARLVAEVLPPDSLRGGIVLGVQPIGPDGSAAGEPRIVAAPPGTKAIEFWPIVPKGRLDLRLSVSGAGDLPLVGVHAVRLVEEPAGGP